MSEQPPGTSRGDQPDEPQPEGPQQQVDGPARGASGGSASAGGGPSPYSREGAAHTAESQAPHTAPQPQADPHAAPGQAHQTPEGAWQRGYASYQALHETGPVQEEGVPAQPKPRGSSRILVGATALALVTGLVAGGIGGYVGSRLGDDGSASAPAFQQDKPARAVSNAPAGSVQSVADKVLPSVVQLQVRSPLGSGEGSGVVLSEDGYILTNNHVAKGAEQGRMTAQFSDNRTADVHVVGTDPNSDLAVVKADIAGLVPAERGRSDDLTVGTQVVAIGSPFGLTGTVTSGIVSAKDRPVRVGGENGDEASVLNALQTDAAINPGNSGGPLVDMDGRVVGINSAIISPGGGGGGQEQGGSVGLGFAIPVDQAWRTAEELQKHHSASQTSLGVRVLASSDRPGAQIHSVMPRGAAEGAGLKPGEVITKIDDRVVEDSDTLVAAVRTHLPGDRVTLTVRGADGGGERTVEVTLGGIKAGG